MSDSPRVPDHVPTAWVGELVMDSLVRTWENMRPMLEMLGGDRVRYLILPEHLYDAIRHELDEDSEWQCPDGYSVMIMYSDDGPW